MKNLLVAAATLFTLSAGIASAENPNFGIPQDLRPTAAAAHVSSYGAPAVSLARLQADDSVVNAAANRFGDAQPRN